MNVEPTLCFEEKLFYLGHLVNVGRSHSGVCGHDAIAAAGVARA
ncbi:hypothetical protein [Bradyrhizobium valentinum]|nr:hypothetical protein [Bradyrhizobium valentinum]